MASRPKTEKPGYLNKIHAILKKRYAPLPKPPSLNVLDTMLYAVCLEDSLPGPAFESMQRVLKSFHDLNEIRVSSIEEIEPYFNGQSEPEYRASRFKGILQYVFEQTYSFDFEAIKKKSMELADKQLLKIRQATPFVRMYVLQHSLGAHQPALDQRQLEALRWLEAVPPTTTAEEASNLLRNVIRKADAVEFCLLLRLFALDPAHAKALATPRPELREGEEYLDAETRLERLLRGEPAPWIRPAAGEPRKGKKAAPSKTASRKPAAKSKPAAARRSAAKSGAASAPSRKAKPKAKPAKPSSRKTARSRSG